ncbi:hypothetical protein JTE90_017777 [Oedothorax gibbosus]|uniref:Uncharacterized protein n=1 Tax=Oedothorax gibbosus TaxID=931172 RepID=A0AAV6UMA8_9ARAC|nr:hypothetical protein JTE90_017777 [Oedothorax gibbosus]
MVSRKLFWGANRPFLTGIGGLLPGPTQLRVFFGYIALARSLLSRLLHLGLTWGRKEERSCLDLNRKQKLHL